MSMYIGTSPLDENSRENTRIFEKDLTPVPKSLAIERARPRKEDLSKKVGACIGAAGGIAIGASPVANAIKIVDDPLITAATLLVYGGLTAFAVIGGYCSKTRK